MIKSEGILTDLKGHSREVFENVDMGAYEVITVCDKTTQYEKSPPTSTTDRVCVDCGFKCKNGGVCVGVPKDCADPTAGLKPFCDCNPRGAIKGTCLYGGKCEFNDVCSKYEGKEETKSCTWNTIQDSFEWFFPTAMCSDEEPKDYCGQS